ncbi:MAG TPA: hypothetical protein VF803_01765, partial [Candidatus Paceibacterota bacterium]
MWIVSIMPIGPVAPHKEFSYWSADQIDEGSIVEVPARGGTSYGLVMRCDPLASRRQEVRGADFSFKKISGSGNRILSRHFLRATFGVAQHHLTSAGAVLDTLIPQRILESRASLPPVSFDAPVDAAEDIVPQVFVGMRDERADRAISLIKKTLSARKSALLIAPTMVEARRLAGRVGEKLPATPLIYIDSALTKKALQSAWRAAIETQEPVVVVGTMQALSCPREHFGAIVVERAGARAYHRDERPYLDIVASAEIFARAHGASFALLSPAPLVSSENPQTYRTGVADAIIDMRTPRKTTDAELQEEKKPFSVFSDTASEAIGDALKKGENILLLCARRGLATQTVCRDCGSLLSCPVCSSSLVLKENRGVRSFHCPHCGHAESAKILCRTCSSWRLTPLGVGTERTAQEVEAAFPRTTTIIADEKQITSYKRMTENAERFEEGRGMIYVATAGALPYLTHIDLTVVVSIDTLLFAPEYSAPENALGVLAEASGLSKRLILQTRTPEHPAIRALESGDMKSFFEEERAMRVRFGYPPATTLIKFTVAGTAQSAKAQIDPLLTALSKYKPITFSGKPTVPRHIREHILVRMPSAEHPELKLLAIAR